MILAQLGVCAGAAMSERYALHNFGRHCRSTECTLCIFVPFGNQIKENENRDWKLAEDSSWNLGRRNTPLLEVVPNAHDASPVLWVYAARIFLARSQPQVVQLSWHLPRGPTGILLLWYFDMFDICVAGCCRLLLRKPMAWVAGLCGIQLSMHTQVFLNLFFR